ncbi:MAG TPA: DUF2505 family protein [Myxococcaceae bacterium]|jgi:hypothetical protein|nr:DUF2505 family protein [Myxococcaceae bacterium]
MRFEVRQRVQGSVEEVEKAFLHPEYLSFLLQQHPVLLEAQPLQVQDEGDRIRRRIRYRPRPVIKHVGPKEIPPEWFAFVEESTWDKRRKELSFRNVPTSHAISDMLENTGTLRLRDVGGATERTLEGEIHVKVPFFLKPLALIAEKIIQVEGIKILDAELPLLNRFVGEVVRGGRA